MFVIDFVFCLYIVVCDNFKNGGMYLGICKLCKIWLCF